MRTVVNRFININIAIPDFQIESAFRIGANPGFVLNCSSLAAEIRKGNQISGFTFLTLGEIIVRFQKAHLPTSDKYAENVTRRIVH
jgi:hypothetical protein